MEIVDGIRRVRPGRRVTASSLSLLISKGQSRCRSLRVPWWATWVLLRLPARRLVIGPCLRLTSSRAVLDDIACSATFQGLAKLALGPMASCT